MPAMAIIVMLAHNIDAGMARSYNSYKKIHRLRRPANQSNRDQRDQRPEVNGDATTRNPKSQNLKTGKSQLRTAQRTY